MFGFFDDFTELTHQSIPQYQIFFFQVFRNTNANFNAKDYHG